MQQDRLTEANAGRPGVAAPGRRGRPMLASVAAAGLIALGVAAGWAMLQPPAGATGPVIAEPLPVEAAPIASSPSYTIARWYSGRVTARRASEVGFERPGLVIALAADDGDRVNAGQVLARLDTESLELTRRQTAAELAEVQARLALARATYERRRALAGRGNTSAQDLDDSRFSAAALNAQTERLRAALAGIDLDLRKSALVAPFDAVVTRRMIDEGTVVASAQPVFRLLEAGASEARIGVPPAVGARLAVGSTQDLVVGGEQVRATVTAVVDELDAGTRTMTVILAIDRTLAGPSGQLARLRVEDTVASAGFWLPTTALTEGLRGLWSVFVLRPGAAPATFTVTRAEVEVLHAEADRAFVRGTLADGDLVVRAGIHRLVPGQRVRLASAVAEVVR